MGRDARMNPRAPFRGHVDPGVEKARLEVAPLSELFRVLFRLWGERIRGWFTRD